MQIGLNLLCLTTRIDDSHWPMIEQIRAAGYDGVEVPVFEGTPDEYQRLGERLAGLGLRRTVVAITASREADPTSSDPDAAARGRAHLAWLVECSAALGAESIGGPFHAAIGHFTGTGPSEDEIARGVAAHQQMAEAAARHGMVLSLEALNRFETYFLNTMEQCAAYAARVGHPAFRIMFDTFHANIEEQDPVGAFRKIADVAGVVHLSENDRGIVGRGHVPFDRHLTTIKATGFDGWLVVEAFGNALPALAAATRVWRPLFPDYPTLFTESLDFVRRRWAAA